MSLPRTISSTMIASAIALPMALASTTPAAATASGPDYYRVVNVTGTDSLHLRAWPSTRSRILEHIPFDAREIENEGGYRRGWVKVHYGGKTGWVRNKFVAEETGSRRTLFKVAHVRYDDVLNLRARPRTGAFILGAIPRDGVGLVSHGECRNNYCKVRYGAMKGWVSKRFIKVQAWGRPHRSDWRERRAYARKRMQYLRLRFFSNWFDRFEDGRNTRPAAYSR